LTFYLLFKQIKSENTASLCVYHPWTEHIPPQPPPHANPDQIHHVVVFSPAHTSSLVFNFQDGASSFNCKLKTKRYKKLYHSIPLQRHARRPRTPRPVVGRALTAAELQRISHHLRVTLNKPTLRSPFFGHLSRDRLLLRVRRGGAA
jgi:hypothetical protein